MPITPSQSRFEAFLKDWLGPTTTTTTIATQERKISSGCYRTYLPYARAVTGSMGFLRGTRVTQLDSRTAIEPWQTVVKIAGAGKDPQADIYTNWLCTTGLRRRCEGKGKLMPFLDKPSTTKTPIFLCPSLRAVWSKVQSKRNPGRRTPDSSSTAFKEWYYLSSKASQKRSGSMLINHDAESQESAFWKLSERNGTKLITSRST